ncbi:hypothetical protein [Flavobacterium sp.]|uniref:hypothetical protein n=1 Tax=Flavobacterium sp. TaxID=239 RepID=UPI0037529092
MKQNVEMVYITKANAKRILYKANISDVSKIDDVVFDKEIYFLSSFEKNYLLHMKTLLKNPEQYFIEIYKPVVNKDTYSLVYESPLPPAYHADVNCSRLQSTFKNFEVPHEIKDRVRAKAEKEGKNTTEILELEKQQVEIFRTWFKKNLHSYNCDMNEFLKQLDIRWNVQRKITEIELGNSGIEAIENMDLEELHREINKIITAAGKFFNNNLDKQQVIRRFQKLTFLTYKPDEIYNNDTELSDAELKQFLKEYDQSFKKPVQQLLIQYYRVKYNTNLTFSGKLLKQLQFVPCASCHGESLFEL